MSWPRSEDRIMVGRVGRGSLTFEPRPGGKILVERHGQPFDADGLMLHPRDVGELLALMHRYEIDPMRRKGRGIYTTACGAKGVAPVSGDLSRIPRLEIPLPGLVHLHAWDMKKPVVMDIDAAVRKFEYTGDAWDGTPEYREKTTVWFCPNCEAEKDDPWRG